MVLVAVGRFETLRNSSGIDRPRDDHARLVLGRDLMTLGDDAIKRASFAQAPREPSFGHPHRHR